MRSYRIATLLGISLVATSTAAAADGPTSAEVGDSWFALPAIHRVPVMALSEPRLGVSFTGGYAATFAQDGNHHRLIALPAIGWVVQPWLELGIQADSRYDMHPGGDVGMIADPRVVAKLGTEAAENVQVGVQLGGWFPGTEKPADTLQAASPEASFFGAFTNTHLTLAAFSGYRLDQSKKAGRNAARLSQGDRLALGLSEFNEVLAGIGGGYRSGPLVFLGEVSAELPIGSGAPSPTQAPLRASAGVRYFASAQLQLEGMLEASLSSPPAVGPTEPLVAIEPRIGALLGIRYRFVPDAPLVVEKSAPPRPKPVAKPKPVPKIAPKTDLTLLVRGRDGQLLTDAHLELVTATGTETPVLDEQGAFQLKDLALGRATLKVTASGYLPIKKEIVLTKEPARIELNLEISLAGQVRGLVRSFGGTAVSAKIRIQPGDLGTTTDAEGFFELDVAPGTYQVSIEADGFVTQQRKVEVEKNGVVVLNADLVKK